MKIAALVLAAGGSARLGRPKQLLRYQGQSLVRRAGAAALEAGCSPVVVVVGREHEKIAAELQECSVRLLPNEAWERGIGTSIRRGVGTLRTCDAIVILVCDQPHVDQRIIRTLIRAQEETRKPIAACAYGRTLGVPALFVRRYFDLLLALADEAGAKSIIEAQPNEVAQVAFAKGAIDIDTTADFEGLLELQ